MPPFAGAAAAVFTFARCVCMKIFGGCPVTILPGNARIAVIRMDLATNRLNFLSNSSFNCEKNSMNWVICVSYLFYGRLFFFS